MPLIKPPPKGSLHVDVIRIMEFMQININVCEHVAHWLTCARMLLRTAVAARTTSVPDVFPVNSVKFMPVAVPYRVEFYYNFGKCRSF